MARPHEKLVAFAIKGINHVGIYFERVLPDKFVEQLWIGLDFYLTRLLGVSYECAPVFRGEQDKSAKKEPQAETGSRFFSVSKLN